MTEPSSSGPEIATVRSFLEALEDLDIDRAVALLDPDVVYQNVSLPRASGIPAVTRQLRRLARYCTRFEARIHHIAADGPIVLTERTDVLEVRGWRAEFWVCGTFEVRDRRIVLWRDYFDWANLVGAGLRGAARAVAARLGRGGRPGQRRDPAG